MAPEFPIVHTSFEFISGKVKTTILPVAMPIKTKFSLALNTMQVAAPSPICFPYLAFPS